MIQIIVWALFFLMHIFGDMHGQDIALKKDHNDNEVLIMQADSNVHKFVLKNGLTVLIVPVKQASQVSVQIWYNVGSKHETFGQRGMAHFIEHMVFKGTEEMLSESDSNSLGAKLGATVNAATSYDYTMYYFTLPVANWEKILPIFADWMQHCRFKQDHMDSEVKAVIQELKMINDDFGRLLLLSMISNIFDSHPYHYSVIGFKQDLWNLKRDTLLQFYKKHYIPQNATLVIAGDVDPQLALKKITKEFESISCDQTPAPLSTFFNEDIVAKKIVLYRDIEQPIAKLAFVLPGCMQKNSMTYDILARLLTNTKNSRLYKKLVDELSLVTSIFSFSLGLYERDLFYINFTPNSEKDCDRIKTIILQEIQAVVDQGFTAAELQQAIKFCQIEYQQKLESVQSVAQELGHIYLATGDKDYIFQDITGQESELQNRLIYTLKNYFKPSLCHEGYVFKIASTDKNYLEKIQQQTAQQDGQTLAGKERESVVEPVKYAATVVAEKIKKKKFVKPELYTLSNGLEVVLCDVKGVDLVACGLALKADNTYTPKGSEGVFNLMSALMLEGTQKYPGSSLAQELALYGIGLSIVPGFLSWQTLSSDVAKGFELVSSILKESTFDKKDFDRIKEKQKISLKSFWDNPRNMIMQKAKEFVYKDHPYSICALGTEQSLNNVDRDQCFKMYKKYISPDKARLIVVGNFDTSQMKIDIQNAFSEWTGPKVDEISYPELKSCSSEVIMIEKNRDQVFMSFVGLSVPFHHPDYDALLVFDQILTGSSLRGMDTLLFRLREQTGLFYTAGGSIVSGADKEPGMIFILTMVAPDRVQEAYDAFMKVLLNSVDLITDEEFETAKENILTASCAGYDMNMGRVCIFNFLRKHNLPFDYVEQQFDRLRNMIKNEMVTAVKKLLQKDRLSCIKIGKCLEKNKDTQ